MNDTPTNAEAVELLDVLDENGRPTGLVKQRQQVHRDGDWHAAFHLWLVRRDRTVVLQRRSQLKDLEPGKVDVTVGGHLAAGETAYSGLREVREELGVELSPTDLVPLGSWRSERSYPEMVDREHQHAFLAVDERPLEEYQLDCQEVYLLYEVPLTRLISLYQDGSPVPAAGLDCQRRRNDALLIPADLIAQASGVAVEQLRAVQDWLDQHFPTA